ncbi:hypothetical protein MASR2M17_13350 [Aminivibrio sp.]
MGTAGEKERVLTPCQLPCPGEIRPFPPQKEGVHLAVADDGYLFFLQAEAEHDLPVGFGPNEQKGELIVDVPPEGGKAVNVRSRLVGKTGVH